MNNGMKKFLCVVLAILLAVGTMPVTAGYSTPPLRVEINTQSGGSDYEGRIDEPFFVTPKEAKDNVTPLNTDTYPGTRISTFTAVTGVPLSSSSGTDRFIYNRVTVTEAEIYRTYL